MKTAFAPPSLPERCVIVIPGHNVEVPVYFKSWIYGRVENEITEESRNKRQHTLGAAAVSATKSSRKNRIKPRYNRKRLEPKLSLVKKKR